MTGPIESSSRSVTAPGRRSLLGWLAFLSGAAASAAVGVPIVGYVFGALRRRKTLWLSLGAVGRFPLNETRLETFDNPLRQPWDGITARVGVYVRNLGPDRKRDEQFLIFAINCTHLGCPVTWFPESGLFMCPCHGGVYYENGERASGPPPRGLYHCVWRVRRGRLEIQAPHLPTLQDTLDEPSATHAMDPRANCLARLDDSTSMPSREESA
jgi:menaquinol-cytochrome c reductase iron-sulfur subunit